MTAEEMAARPLILLAFLAFLGPASGLCPSQCRCDDDDLKTVCTGGNLTVVPIFLNPGVRRLDVARNRISKLEGALSFYASLERLDLSGNSFKHLGRGQFSNQAKLQELNLSNNFLTTLKEGSFRGPEALQTLDLSHNALTSLGNDSFAGLGSLVELRLHNNHLSEFSSGAFNGLSRLRRLHLESNKIASISSSYWMSPLENLRFLYATDNSIRSLPDDAFKSLSALKVIELSGNQLSEIGEFAFRGAADVDTLDLSDNLLTSVPSQALSQVPRLDMLDLSANPISRVGPGAFSSAFALHTLRMSRMPDLETVDGHAFVGSLKLRELWLEANPELSPLPWGVFDTNVNLETVGFKNNTWSTLSPHQIPKQSLRSLYLEGIPLNCNCSVIWLWEIYRRNESGSGVLQMDRVRCSSVSAPASSSSSESSEDGISNVQVGGSSGDPLSVMSGEQLICSDSTAQILIVVSASILATVLALVLIAVLALKCRQYRLRQRCYGSATCMHIKDDTMIYKHGALSHFSSPSNSSSSPGPTASAAGDNKAVVQETGADTAEEPFYEVPKYSTASKSSDSSTTVGGMVWEIEEQDYFNGKRSG